MKSTSPLFIHNAPLYRELCYGIQCGFIYFILEILIVSSSVMAADIRDTRHNLSGKAWSDEEREKISKDEERRLLATEICIFCHTPSADMVIDKDKKGGESHQKAPLWQRSIDKALSFELYDDIGKVGSDGGNPVGSVSMACLSCHDSTQALGISNTYDNHPFGIPYRGISSEFLLTMIRDRLKEDEYVPTRLANYIREDSEFRPAKSAVINQRRVWWASTQASGQRTKNDLPLYPRKGKEEGDGDIPFVECTSCHDPHTTRETFLRTAAQNSQLCATCHVK